MELLAAAAAAPAAPACAPEVGNGAASPGLFSIDADSAGRVANITKGIFVLGTVEKIAELQDNWVGEGAPPIDVEAADGKPHTTVDSLATKTKGHKDPVSINAKAPCVGIAFIESLVRVLLACPSEILVPGAQLLQNIGTALTQNLSLDVLSNTTSEDRQIVLLMIAMKGHRVQSKRISPNYLGLDKAILKLLVLIPDLSRRLDACGHVIAQLYVDFFRCIGELSALDNWEKKTTLTEEVARAKLRTMGYFVPAFALDAETLDSIWQRSLK